MRCFNNLLEVALNKIPDKRGDLSILYHATKKKSLPSIMRRGLDPMKSAYADDEEANDYDGFGPPYHFTFLSSKIGAIEFMPKAGALLKIALPQELQDQLILDRGEFIRAPFVIDPQYIKIVPF